MAGLISAYLEELEGALRVSAALKARVMEEASAHLDESVARNRDRGLREIEAEQTAIATFGSPKAIAMLYATDRAQNSATRIGATLIPLIVAIQLVYQVGGHFLPPGSKPRDIDTVMQIALINLYSVVFLIAVVAGVFVLWRVHAAPRLRAVGSVEFVRVTVAVLVIALSAVVAAGATTLVFIFKLPGTPPFGVQVAMAAASLLVLVTGAVLLTRAADRYRSVLTT